MRYARLLHCIVWDGIERSRSTAAREMKGVCVCVFMRETNIASASVCVYVLFANAKASSVPPSCVSVVIRVVICTGCDTDAAAFWTASGQQNECV